jgi:hypothetical protein
MSARRFNCEIRVKRRPATNNGLKLHPEAREVMARSQLKELARLARGDGGDELGRDGAR